MIKKILQSKIQILTLIFVFALSVQKIAKEEQVYSYGDAAEYALMTEAIYNHFSPDMREADCDSFKELYTKSNKWETNIRYSFYDGVKKFINDKKQKKFEYYTGFFINDKGDVYSAHFFFYSIVNIPMRWICGLVHFNPLLIFQFTNVLLLLITSFLFFKYSSFSELETAVFVLLFFYSTNYWYLPWQHAEIFTTCFTALGFWLFADKKQYAGIFLLSVAATQNQPLAILVAILSLITLYTKGFNIRNIIFIGLSSILVLYPSVFYYCHFGAFNLIAHVGSIQTGLVTFNRVFGFFFDINQGTILALPLILPLYIILILRKAIRIKKEENKWELLIPIALIGAVCSAAMIDNWNHGQAVVNRYVTYIGAVILVHSFLLLIRINNKILKGSLLTFSLATQIATVYYHQPLIRWDWSGNDSKPLSDWVLENYPSCYNPDPTIFNARYGFRPVFNIKEMPAYYMKANGEITKILIHKDYLYTLFYLGFTKEQVSEILRAKKFVNGWTYIDINKKFRSTFSNSKLLSIDNNRRMKEEIKRVKETPDWYELIKKQALANGSDLEEEVRKAAAYVLHIQLQTVETRPERIQRKIREIKADKGWYDFIKVKAEKVNVPVDSAIIIDATFEADQEIKKQKELERSE